MYQDLMKDDLTNWPEYISTCEVKNEKEALELSMHFGMKAYDIYEKLYFENNYIDIDQLTKTFSALINTIVYLNLLYFELFKLNEYLINARKYLKILKARLSNELHEEYSEYLFCEVLLECHEFSLKIENISNLQELEKQYEKFCINTCNDINICQAKFKERFLEPLEYYLDQNESFEGRVAKFLNDASIKVKVLNSQFKAKINQLKSKESK